VPPRDIPVPPAVATVARRHHADRIEPLWRNELGGVTFRAGTVVVKWQGLDVPLDLAEEASRLRWAHRWTPVPRVLEEGVDRDGRWLVTEAMPGENAVADRWRAEPARAVHALGEGLRALHDSLPVEVCPFTWHAEDRVAAKGFPDPPPPVDRLVVCHGDACAPNTLIDDEGRWSAHVDLGNLGVADRWADIAVAALSTTWNYGADWTDALLAAYGVERNDERLDYYRRLWDFES